MLEKAPWPRPFWSSPTKGDHPQGVFNQEVHESWTPAQKRGTIVVAKGYENGSEAYCDRANLETDRKWLFSMLTDKSASFLGITTIVSDFSFSR